MQRGVSSGKRDELQLPMTKRRKIYLTMNRMEIVIHIPYRIAVEMIKPHVKNGEMINLNELTTREREVFEIMRRGRCNKEIANALNLSERTVKFHASQLYAKIPGVRNRGDIMAKYGVAEKKPEVMVQ
jgi:DNA-binding NarL/FixJ family response regulator